MEILKFFIQIQQNKSKDFIQANPHLELSHQNTVEEDLLQIATQLKLDAEQIFQAFKIDMITIEAT